MLGEIKKLLRERGTVASADLARRFDVEESALEKMMERHLLKKGAERIEIERAPGCCRRCGNGCCPAAHAVFYRWIERPSTEETSSG